MVWFYKLQDDEENQLRIVWVAICNIREELAEIDQNKGEENEDN